MSVDSIIAGTHVDPRPYQSRIVNKVVDMFTGAYRNGAGETEPAARSVMIESPTGSGKSCMALLIAKALQIQTGVRVGWCAMRRNLLTQVQTENRRHGIDVDLQTISMFDKNPPSDIDLLIVDECQHDAASSMAHLHSIIQSKWILGLSATPFRCDQIKLCFDKVVTDAGIHQLIQDGYLSPFDHYTIPSWDVKQVAEFYRADPDRWGKSIFFFHTLQECFALRESLGNHGIPSEVVTGTSDRDAQLGAFRNGEVQVLINCMVLTEGFDDPTLKTVWVRPSAKGPTMQMAGRALRKCDGLPVKQIVQCKQTPHPFVKTAHCRQQYLWQSGEWRSLQVNPLLNLCSNNVRRVMAQTKFDLPSYFKRGSERKRRAPIQF